MFLKVTEREKQSLEIERPTGSQVREVMRVKANGVTEKIKRGGYTVMEIRSERKKDVKLRTEGSNYRIAEKSERTKGGVK